MTAPDIRVVKYRVFIAAPTHDGRRDDGSAQALYQTASAKYDVLPVPNIGSLLSASCNAMWASALNSRFDQRISWFAMLHSDVQPDIHWIDTLIEEAEEHDADLMSAIVPIKDTSGTTSTAIAAETHGAFSRLMLKQVWHEDFPATFDLNMAVDALAGLPEPLRIEAPRTELLVNTGCFVCRIDRPWSMDESIAEHQIWFDDENEMKLIDGKWTPLVLSEDWLFSQRIARAGAKVMATRKVKTIHKGISLYPSTGTWGKERDEDCMKHQLAEV